MGEPPRIAHVPRDWELDREAEVDDVAEAIVIVPRRPYKSWRRSAI